MDKGGAQIKRKNLLKMLPYVILGASIFCFNSSLDLPYFIRGYSTLLEFQVGFLILYFLVQKKPNRKDKN
jgi:hypothetical protein